MPFLTAAWHDLIFINWSVDARLLAPHVAAGTELDLWNGDAMASIVAFDFRETRVLGLPVPFHVRFPEVNLRFYVRRRAPDGSWRRGVSFIQEMVPRRAIAFVARAFYGEPYVARRMRQRAEENAATESRTTSYEWKRDNTWERVIASTQGRAAPMVSGSNEEFIAEHYWGYTRRPGKRTIEYQVQHPRWNVWTPTEWRLDADLRTLYGAAFADTLATAPQSVFVAEGSPVSVSYGTPLADTR